jgi:hypothetical protein
MGLGELNMKEKRWLGTQKKEYEIHCFYCGGFHITGNCPQVVKAMNGWKYDRSCPETGHIKIVPNGDEYPTVLAFNGYHYRVVGLWGIPGRLLWLELERFYGDTIVAATFCPDELMEMDLGMSDDEQLSAWLGGLPFLSVSPPEFNGSEAEVDVKTTTTDALAEAAEDLIDSLDKIKHPAFVGYTKIEAARAALAALKAMEES